MTDREQHIRAWIKTHCSLSSQEHPRWSGINRRDAERAGGCGMEGHAFDEWELGKTAMYKIDEELRNAFEQEISKGLTEKAIEGLQKDLRNVADSFEDHFMWNLKDNLAYNLTAYVADMAEGAVNQMLAGNDDQMRRYLSCDKRGEDGQYIGWTGRSDGYGTRKDEEWHPVIHGKLFEQGAVELRKQVARANETLIRDERILDLEDQVKSLVAQLNKANAAKEEMWQRVRALT